MNLLIPVNNFVSHRREGLQNFDFMVEWHIFKMTEIETGGEGGSNDRHSISRAPQVGKNVDVTAAKATREARRATWNLGTNSTFAIGLRKTTVSLDSRSM
jgi:hypothetical protein